MEPLGEIRLRIGFGTFDTYNARRAGGGARTGWSIPMLMALQSAEQ
jgi:hypothetical protein